jgi:hypothetical protein
MFIAFMTTLSVFCCNSASHQVLFFPWDAKILVTSRHNTLLDSLSGRIVISLSRSFRYEWVKIASCHNPTEANLWRATSANGQNYALNQR